MSRFSEIASSVYLTCDPRVHNSNVPMVTCLGSIRLEVYQSEPVDTSIKILAFGVHAERLVQCIKGDTVAVSGDLQAIRYEGAIQLQVNAKSLLTAATHAVDAYFDDDGVDALDDQSDNFKIDDQSAEKVWSID